MGLGGPPGNLFENIVALDVCIDTLNLDTLVILMDWLYVLSFPDWGGASVEVRVQSHAFRNYDWGMCDQ